MRRRDGIDSKLVDVVERMFESCLSDGEHFQAIGIALESKRLDKLEEAITRSNTVAECLSYSMKVCASLVSVREFQAARLAVACENVLVAARTKFFEHVSVFDVARGRPRHRGGAE